MDYIPAPIFDRVPEHLIDLHGYSNLGVLKKLHPDDIGEEHRQLHEERWGSHVPEHTHVRPADSQFLQAMEPVMEAIGLGHTHPGTVQAPAEHPASVCCTSFAAMRFCPWCGSPVGDNRGD